MKSMNRIFYSLLTAFVMVSFMGCSEDDEAAVATEAELVGSWKMQSAEINEFKINGKDIVDYMIEAFEMSEEEAKAAKASFEEEIKMESGMTIELKSNHTFVAEEEGGDPDEGTWKLISDGKKLLIDEGTDDEQEFDITAISSSKLSLSSQMSEKWDMDQDGTDETSVIKMTINFTK